MDLNDLYHRHQISVFMSANGTTASARATHLGLAEDYASRIDTVKQGQRAPEGADPLAVEAVSKTEIVA